MVAPCSVQTFRRNSGTAPKKEVDLGVIPRKFKSGTPLQAIPDRQQQGGKYHVGMIEETGSSGDDTVSIKLDSSADISVLSIGHGYPNVGKYDPNARAKMMDAPGREHHKDQAHGDELRWQKSGDQGAIRSRATVVRWQVLEKRLGH